MTEHILKEAILKGNVDEIRHLASKNAFPNLASHMIPDGASSVHIAAILGYTDCVTTLLGKDDVNVNKKDLALGWTPLLYSVENGHKEITRLLLKSGKCNTNIQDRFGQRALHIEAQVHNENTEVLEWLLRSKAAINAQDAEGMTAFMRACETNNLAAAKFLYSKGCLVNLSSLHGKSPMHFAAKICNEELVAFLVSIQCNVNGVDNKFQTPLMVCVQQGKNPSVLYAIMKYMIDAGSFVNCQDYHGNTPLLLGLSNPACIKSKHIELLLSAGADPDIYNRDSLTPLWLAVYDYPHDSDCIKIIALLLNQNCNPNISSRGKLLFTTGLNCVYSYETHVTPFEVAMDSVFYPAAQMLAYAGCNTKTDIRLTRSNVPPELQWFCDLTENAASLQQICRLAIRRIFNDGPMYSKMQKLPLPERIKSYLLLEDILEYCNHNE